MSNNNFLSIVYVYRDDDFEQGDGLRNLSFSINNIFENIKRNNLLSAIKIYLVEWGANLEKPITRKLFLKDEFIHSLVYVPILSKDYEEKNFFNTCIAMNALIRRCESDFFLTCVGRTFFNSNTFDNLISFLKNKNFENERSKTFYSISRFMLKYNIKSKRNHNHLNNFINNYSSLPERNFHYPGLVGGNGALVCSTELIKKVKGFNESFWWGMNDIELGYRMSSNYNLRNLYNRNIFCFDVNKQSNNKRKSQLNDLDNSFKENDNNWGLRNRNLDFIKINKIEKTSFDNIYQNKPDVINFFDLFFIILKSIYKLKLQIQLRDIFVIYISKIYKLDKLLISLDEKPDFKLINHLGNLFPLMNFDILLPNVRLNNRIIKCSMKLSECNYLGRLNFYNNKNHNSIFIKQDFDLYVTKFYDQNLSEDKLTIFEKSTKEIFDNKDIHILNKNLKIKKSRIIIDSFKKYNEKINFLYVLIFVMQIPIMILNFFLKNKNA